MSSVSGLKERPSTATERPASGPAAAAIFSIIRALVSALTQMADSMIRKR